jgi:hypothetical protein
VPTTVPDLCVNEIAVSQGLAIEGPGSTENSFQLPIIYFRGLTHLMILFNLEINLDKTTVF